MGTDRAAVPVERLVVWLVVVAAVVAIAGTAVTVGEAWQRETPDTDVSVSFDAATATVTVTHDGGTPIRDRRTNALAVVLRSSNASTQVVWASDETGGYPVTEGNTLSIDDHTVDADGDGNVHDAEASVGVPLTVGDRVRVVWTGNLRGGPERTVRLANATLG